METAYERAKLLRAAIATVSGKAVDLTAPNWRDVDLADIAFGLSLIPRWAGQRIRQISVLEHTMDVWRTAPEPLKLEALLHDGHEAYTGDITRPMQRAILALSLGARNFFDAIGSIQARLDLAIVRQTFFACGLPEEMQDMEARFVVEAMRGAGLCGVDDEVLACEAADLCYPRREAPLRVKLVDAWLAAVHDECAKRYGKGGGNGKGS